MFYYHFTLLILKEFNIFSKSDFHKSLRPLCMTKSKYANDHNFGKYRYAQLWVYYRLIVF
jgi:hypothetical protein